MLDCKFASLFAPLGMLIFALYSLAKRLCNKLPEGLAIAACALSFVLLLVGFVQQLIAIGARD